MFLPKYSLDRNNTIALLLRTQYSPDFLIAEYYGFRNTIFWGSKDLASGNLKPVLWIRIHFFRIRIQNFFALFGFGSGL
jgi:hypothetical protein